MTKSFFILSSVLLIFTVPRFAQTYGLPAGQAIDPVGYYINQSFWSNKAFTTAMTQSLMRSGGKGKAKATAGVSNAAVGVTAFRSTASILPNVIASADRNAASSAEMKAVLDQLLALYRQTAANDGFPANDLAYAFEYYVVNNYQVYHNLLDPYADPEIARLTDPLARLQAYKIKESQRVTLTQERAIYDQFRRVLSDNPEIKKMTDRQKQEATELLALSTGMAYLQFTKGSQNKSPDQIEKGRQTAKKNLERLSARTADQIRITNNGLEF